MRRRPNKGTPAKWICAHPYRNEVARRTLQRRAATPTESVGLGWSHARPALRRYPRPANRKPRLRADARRRQTRHHGVEGLRATPSGRAPPQSAAARRTPMNRAVALCDAPAAGEPGSDAEQPLPRAPDQTDQERSIQRVQLRVDVATAAVLQYDLSSEDQANNASQGEGEGGTGSRLRRPLVRGPTRPRATPAEPARAQDCAGGSEVRTRPSVVGSSGDGPRPEHGCRTDTSPATEPAPPGGGSNQSTRRALSRPSGHSRSNWSTRQARLDGLREDGWPDPPFLGHYTAPHPARTPPAAAVATAAAAEAAACSGDSIITRTFVTVDDPGTTTGGPNACSFLKCINAPAGPAFLSGQLGLASTARAASVGVAGTGIAVGFPSVRPQVRPLGH